MNGVIIISMAKHMNEDRIMEIVEYVEMNISQKLDDRITYEITAEEISNATSTRKEDIDFGVICMYALHEIITTDDKKGKSARFPLFLKMEYTDGVLVADINPDIRGYFEMLKNNN